MRFPDIIPLSLILIVAITFLLPHCLSADYNIGNIAENFTLLDMNGVEHSLYDYEGHIIVLNFFVYWCHICQGESTRLEKEIWQFYNSENGNPNNYPVIVIGIADLMSPLGGSYKQQFEKTQNYIETYGLTFPILQDYNEKEGVLRLKYCNGNTPHNTIINGVFGDPYHEQWELIFDKTGFREGYEDQIISEMKERIDSISGPLVNLDLWIPTDQAFFQHGDSFDLFLNISTPMMPVSADIYFIMLSHSDNFAYFASTWGNLPIPFVKSFTIPPVSYSGIRLLEVHIPGSRPLINDPGLYTFAIGATKPGSNHFISNIGSWTIEVR